MVDIFETLHDDHEELLRLVDQLERGGRDEGLLADLAREFRGHRAAEEEILYPRLESDEKVGSAIREAYVEHHLAGVLLRETELQSSGNAEFRARMKVFGEMLRHHIAKEETDVFLRARQVLPARDQIGLNDALNDERRRAA